MLTCIINQLDCNAGTRGAAVCIGVGKIRLANEITSKVMGKIIAPISLVLVFDSIINKIKSKHQSKNRSDSYKLLKGKYPEIIQRKPKTTKSKKFEEN